MPDGPSRRPDLREQHHPPAQRLRQRPEGCARRTGALGRSRVAGVVPHEPGCCAAAFSAAGLAAPFLARHGFAQGDWPKGRCAGSWPSPPAALPTRWRAMSAPASSEIIGQQVIVDNRTGGNSLVAANAVLQAPRDGQTFLIDAANQLTNPFLIKDLPFDYAEDLVAGDQAVGLPAGRGGEAGFSAKSLQEYVAAAKAKPGTISYGTPPAAGMGHMARRRAAAPRRHQADPRPLSRRRRRRARHRRGGDRFGDHHHQLDPTAAGGRRVPASWPSRA